METILHDLPLTDNSAKYDKSILGIKHFDDIFDVKTEEQSNFDKSSTIENDHNENNGTNGISNTGSDPAEKYGIDSNFNVTVLGNGSSDVNSGEDAAVVDCHESLYCVKSEEQTIDATSPKSSQNITLSTQALVEDAHDVNLEREVLDQGSIFSISGGALEHYSEDVHTTELLSDVRDILHHSSQSPNFLSGHTTSQENLNEENLVEDSGNQVYSADHSNSKDIPHDKIPNDTFLTDHAASENGINDKFKDSVSISFNNDAALDDIDNINRGTGNDTYHESSNTYQNGTDTYQNGNDTYQNGNDTYQNGNDTYQNGNDTYQNGNDTYQNGHDTYHNGNDIYYDDNSINEPSNTNIPSKSLDDFSWSTSLPNVSTDSVSNIDNHSEPTVCESNVSSSNTTDLINSALSLDTTTSSNLTEEKLDELMFDVSSASRDYRRSSIRKSKAFSTDSRLYSVFTFLDDDDNDDYDYNDDVNISDINNRVKLSVKPPQRANKMSTSDINTTGLSDVKVNREINQAEGRESSPEEIGSSSDVNKATVKRYDSDASLSGMRKIIPDKTLLIEEDLSGTPNTRALNYSDLDFIITNDYDDDDDDLYDDDDFREIDFNNQVTSTPFSEPDAADTTDNVTAITPLPQEYSTREEFQDNKDWRIVVISEQTYRIDMKAIEPYKKVLAHGGYYGNGLNAIIVFMACHLPERSVADYQYIMDNLFLYVISTLELLVVEDYMIVYFHGATPRRRFPSLRWLRRCYDMIDRKLKKNLRSLVVVHPTLFLRTVLLMTKPFISSKFAAKIRYVKSLYELTQTVPTEYIFVPAEVIRCRALIAERLKKSNNKAQALGLHMYKF